VFNTKYFAKTLATISCNFYFHYKIYKHFLQKKNQNKISRKYEFF